MVCPLDNGDDFMHPLPMQPYLHEDVLGLTLVGVSNSRPHVDSPTNNDRVLALSAPNGVSASSTLTYCIAMGTRPFRNSTSDKLFARNIPQNGKPRRDRFRSYQHVQSEARTALCTCFLPRTYRQFRCLAMG